MEKCTPNNADFEDLMTLNKNEAIKKYGEPHFSEQFILEGLQRRFRISLNNFFTKEELFSKTIVIDELTWEKNIDTWITVWYQVIKNNTIPKNSCTWKKGTDFVYSN